MLALLNSRLYYLWLYRRGKRKGEALELYGKPLSEIPIKKITKADQKPFISIVDKIFAITQDQDYISNPAKQARVGELESQIDQLVYMLYVYDHERFMGLGQKLNLGDKIIVLVYAFCYSAKQS